MNLLTQGGTLNRGCILVFFFFGPKQGHVLNRQPLTYTQISVDHSASPGIPLILESSNVLCRARTIDNNLSDMTINGQSPAAQHVYLAVMLPGLRIKHLVQKNYFFIPIKRYNGLVIIVFKCLVIFFFQYLSIFVALEKQVISNR